MNSSASGTVKSRSWSNRNATCGWWRGEAGAGTGAGGAGGVRAHLRRHHHRLRPAPHRVLAEHEVREGRRQAARLLYYHADCYL